MPQDNSSKNGHNDDEKQRGIGTQTNNQQNQSGQGPVQAWHTTQPNRNPTERKHIASDPPRIKAAKAAGNEQGRGNEQGKGNEQNKGNELNKGNRQSKGNELNKGINQGKGNEQGKGIDQNGNGSGQNGRGSRRKAKATNKTKVTS